MSEPTPGRRPRSRRWCVPPAAHRESHAHLPAIDVLQELGREPGLVLWLLLRDVEIWADAPASTRRTLFRGFEIFAAEAVLPPAISAEVNAVVAMLGGSVPGAGPDACRNIAAWAEPLAPRTTLLFAQAAALLDPASGERARDVARHALQCQQPVRAETWLRRAVALARRQRDWSTYALAYADLGEIHEARTEPAAASDAFQRALRVCRRHSLPGFVRGRPLVGFLRAALREGRADAASRIKRAVLRAVPPADRAAPPIYLALATALASAGRPGEVVSLLRDAMPAHGTEEERFALARLLVRSAADGDPVERERAWEDAIELLQRGARTGAFARLLARLADDLRDVPVA